MVRSLEHIYHFLFFMRQIVTSITHYILYICTAALILSVAGCSKDENFTTDRSALLHFSDDSIKFDTIFTTIGSSTQTLMVYNNNNEGIRLSNVSLKERAASGFRLNLDGQNGTTFNDIEIYGKDSIFCFVEVTVNPQNSNNPVLVTDEIVFTLESGLQQRVCLQAYGQDAIILHSPIITENTTYTDTRPYIIYGPLTIAQEATLTLSPGTRLFFHADGYIDCNGKLYADGTSKQITLRGDRLDRMFSYLPYDRLDNQWQGIRINATSYGNYLNNVDIHSGNYGIIATADNTENVQLTLLNSIIHNVGGNGLTLNGSNAVVGNSQISNTRGNCIEIHGGKYTIDFCTLAQFCPWISDRGSALVFANSDDTGNYTPLTQLDVTNSLITGYGDDEIFGIPTDGISDAAFNFHFTNCLLDTPEPSAAYAENFINCIYQTTDTKTNFHTIDTDNFIYDFRLSENSMARGTGTAEGDMLTKYPADRIGTERNPASIDVGCYQFK